MSAYAEILFTRGIKMPKIKSTLTPNIVDRFGVPKPEGMEFEYVKYPVDDATLIEEIKDADILFCGPVDFIRKEVIDAMPNLKLIQSLGVGFDKIDLEAAKAKGVYVCNNRAVNAVSVAEHAVLLMHASLKQLTDADKKIKEGKFMESFKEYQVKGHAELGGKTVGLVGLGAIGHAAAKILRAYGCRLLYSDVVRAEEAFEKEYELEYVPIETIYEQADIISYHVPVLPDTREMVNKDNIAKMKDGVIIINVARGEIVNNEDLAEALNSGKIFAGLDVVSPEPPPANHPLFHLTEEGNARLVITPHIAGTTDDAFIRMSEWSFENMRKVINGERPNNVVNGL